MHRTTDFLVHFSTQVFVPLLSNSTNQHSWAKPVTSDLKQHIHGLKSTVYQVKGEVCGQTILPLPEGFISNGSEDGSENRFMFY